ncbi:hypothetical protein CL673_03725 [Candidatus Bathyarchaeota archaeon]|jgi:hypothetical protein|nr:hypothetical protein [Candidatus Bathyarchaeota archaeon]MDP6049001.1 DUF166 family protein [Candidatus Bathyarchaeota archaeon]|tara:strand:+ start:80 stop:763 length:684 start_codon:yes stop_codon:yes gene_type:complete
MRVIVFTQGSYGECILENLRLRAPKEWTIEESVMPGGLSILIEEPEEIVDDLDLNGKWDLVLFMGESPSAFTLLPSILEKLETGTVIAPVADYEWLPQGLERQIGSEIEGLGVEIVFPRTFCSLAPVGVPKIDAFAELFGFPKLEIAVVDGEVSCVDVLRGAPCGSTHYMAEKLPGTKVSDAMPRAGTLVQIYPCLASRKVDRFFGDSPIHVAGNIAVKALEKALRK